MRAGDSDEDEENDQLGDPCPSNLRFRSVCWNSVGGPRLNLPFVDVEDFDTKDGHHPANQGNNDDAHND